MIYLIRSASYKDKNNRECNEFESILKIGYTKDNGKFELVYSKDGFKGIITMIQSLHNSILVAEE